MPAACPPACRRSQAAQVVPRPPAAPEGESVPERSAMASTIPHANHCVTGSFMIRTILKQGEELASLHLPELKRRSLAMEPTITAAELENSPRPTVRHQSPPLGVLATVFTVLKLASIACVSLLASRPPFPAPQQPGGGIVSYFRLHPSLILACAFLQFGAPIPLGLFAASR